MALMVGLSAGFQSSTVQVQQNVCEGIGVGEATVNTSVDESVVGVDGLYCANTGGYTVVEELIENENGELEASIVIQPPSEDQIVTQAIESIDFDVLEEVEDGEYDLSYEVEVGDETVASGEEEIVVGEPETQSIIQRFFSWFS